MKNTTTTTATANQMLTISVKVTKTTATEYAFTYAATDKYGNTRPITATARENRNGRVLFPAKVLDAPIKATDITKAARALPFPCQVTLSIKGKKRDENERKRDRLTVTIKTADDLRGNITAVMQARDEMQKGALSTADALKLATICDAAADFIEKTQNADDLRATIENNAATIDALKDESESHNAATITALENEKRDAARKLAAINDSIKPLDDLNAAAMQYYTAAVEKEKAYTAAAIADFMQAITKELK
jgi:hypothetical protein